MECGKAKSLGVDIHDHKKGDIMTRFHEFTMESLEGESVDFSEYAGTACLVVNVASH